MLRIGIVGSGIAGLTAAFVLQRAGHHVTLFEKQASLGMAAHEFRDEAMAVRGDVPSRMFNERLWPNLFQLYNEIGVQVQEVNATQSLSDAKGVTYLGFSKSYRPDVNASLLLDSRSRKILSDIRRLHRRASEDLENNTITNISLSQYLAEGDYSNEFVYGYLYPTLSSTVCTCSYKSLSHYPALIVLEALRQLAHKSPLLKTVNGTSDVVRRLTQAVADVRLSTEVKQIVRRDGKVRVTATCGNASDELWFDHLIVSTQANQAAKIVDALADDERQMLTTFQYEDVPVLVHTDATLMPADKRRWATFNMIVSESTETCTAAAMCTVWMNQFHGDWQTSSNIFQTINPLRMPDESMTVGAARLQRPVVDHHSSGGWQLLSNLNAEPDRNIWFCGSYASRGIPLLESGVTSAFEVCQSIERLAVST